MPAGFHSKTYSLYGSRAMGDLASGRIGGQALYIAWAVVVTTAVLVPTGIRGQTGGAPKAETPQVRPPSRVPFILVLPAYRDSSKLIDAWNSQLARDGDLVTCMPAPQDLSEPTNIEAVFRRIKKGSPGWVTPSAELILSGKAKIPASARWLWYDPEPWQHTPEKEKRDPVATARALREYCQRHNLKFGMTPIYTPLQRNFDMAFVAQVGAHCDAYILQLQDFQKDSSQRERMANLLRQTAEAIHKVNPQCLVGCQLGTGQHYGGLEAALALYQATREWAQLYTAWWEPDESEVIKLLEAINNADTVHKIEKPASASQKINPITELWWIAAEGLTQRNSSAVVAAVEQWNREAVFDAVSVGILPPTFYDLDASIQLANQVNKAARGRLIAGMFPTGTQGWETSCNQRFADRLARLDVQFDKTQEMPLAVWLEKISRIEAPCWALVLEQPARRPTAEEAATATEQFVRCAKKENRKAVLWLSAMMLRTAMDTRTAADILKAVGEQVDYVVWMDLPAVSQDSGHSLESLLDAIIELSPKDKIVIQWNHNPRVVTKDPEGTLAYIATCQGKGLNRFVVLAPPGLLQQEPWATFYRQLRHKP